MKIGDTVVHPKWGRGVILAVEKRARGTFVKVKLGYAIDWFPVSELPGGETIAVPAPATTLKSGAPTHPPVPAGEAQRIASARSAVQALKLGQALEAQVERISVGTAEHEEAFAQAFRKAEGSKPQLIMVEGAWGVGKTHLLTLLSAHASKRRFAVSTTILDGWAASISDPMRLLESIAGSIRFPGQAVPMGIGTMLSTVKRRGMVELRAWAGPRMVQLMEQLPQEALDDPEVIAVLEDYLGLTLPASQARDQLSRLGWRGVALPALKAKSVDERGQRLAELLCDWAAFCVAGGAKGLLVVLDEVDVDYARAPWWDTPRRTKQDYTLQALGALQRQDVPLVVAFGSAPAGPGEDDSVDAVRDVIKKLGHVDAHERAVTLSEGHLIELADKVHDLYADAYPEFANKLSADQLRSITNMLLRAHRRQLSPVPRRFVRSLLHCLDLVDLGQATPASLLNAGR